MDHLKDKKPNIHFYTGFQTSKTNVQHEAKIYKLNKSFDNVSSKDKCNRLLPHSGHSEAKA